ncbi:DNA break repair nuclease [Mortierella alpina]|nr:DNA break repair nuclease [Mortierella alpina]
MTLKHTLIEANLTDPPVPNKKRTISLRRPRSSSSHSPSPAPNAYTPEQDKAVSQTGPDSTRDAAPAQPQFISDSSNQKGGCLQESVVTRPEVCSTTLSSESPKLSNSTPFLCAEATAVGEEQQETQQADDILGKSHSDPTDLRHVPVNTYGSVGSPTTESLFDMDNDPDCSEGQGAGIDDSDFPDIDEIQDWDDFELDTATPIGAECVAENACPTPDAHVNRCLDGSSTVQAPTEPASLPSSSGNPLSTVIGAIRSVIGHIPARRVQETKPKPAAAKKAEGQFKSKPSRPCPFYKKMPDTTFTVDAFCYGAVEGCDAYFLSHFHSDHYGGLTSSWNHGLIYCSSITANLVLSRLRVDEQYIRRLPMNDPTVVNGVTVRLLDANHCPGSVLFVFDLQNPKRRYLHTGDFRAAPEMSIHPLLRQPLNAPIDILYLDTTYSNPRYTFPPQDVVIRETANLICKEVGLLSNVVAPLPSAPVVQVTKKVNIMESWLKKESGNTEKLLSMSIKTSQIIKGKQKWQEPPEKNKIVICVGTYLIGKERVFKAIAKAIKSKVFVQHSKLQIMACLEDPELMSMLTSNRYEAQVHLLHMGSSMSPESLQEYLDTLSPTFTRLIAIRPTGWTFTGTKKYTSADSGATDTLPAVAPTPTTLELRPSFTSPTIKIYPVPYSEHSSFNELAGFVRSLDIRKIIPTVGVGTESHTSDDDKQAAAMTPSQAVSADSKWDETMEMALFYAAIKFKPVGMHKHFRMINLHKHFNKHSHTPCTIAELWERLGGMYDLGTLDEREDSGLFVDENEDEESDEEQDISFKNSEEFVLPLHDYDHLVKEVFREPSRNPSPSPIRTTRAREGSQTPSVADSSRASSPDEDDLPRKRRASRAVKKSDVNETPSPRTSATPTSSTRRTTRAKAPEAAPVTRRKTGKKVFDELCKVRSSPDCNVPNDYQIAIFNATERDDVQFMTDKLGLTFSRYPFLALFPRGIEHTSKEERCKELKVYSDFGSVDKRTRPELCKALKEKGQPLTEDLTGKDVEGVSATRSKSVMVLYYSPDCPASLSCLAAYIKAIEDNSGGQCNVIIAKYEAWKNGVLNGECDIKRVPSLQFIKAKGQSETYDGKCDDQTALVKWINGRLPQLTPKPQDNIPMADEDEDDTNPQSTDEDEEDVNPQSADENQEVVNPQSADEDEEDDLLEEPVAAMPIEAEAPKEEL